MCARSPSCCSAWHLANKDHFFTIRFYGHKYTKIISKYFPVRHNFRTRIHLFLSSLTLELSSLASRRAAATQRQKMF